MKRTVRYYQHDDALVWYDSLSDAERDAYDATFKRSSLWAWGQVAQRAEELYAALARNIRRLRWWSDQ